MNQHSTLLTVLLVMSLLLGMLLDSSAFDAPHAEGASRVASEPSPPGMSDMFGEEKRRAAQQDLPAQF